MYYCIPGSVLLYYYQVLWFSAAKNGILCSILQCYQKLIMYTLIDLLINLTQRMTRLHLMHVARIQVVSGLHDELHIYNIHIQYMMYCLSPYLASARKLSSWLHVSNAALVRSLVNVASVTLVQLPGTLYLPAFSSLLTPIDSRNFLKLSLYTSIYKYLYLYLYPLVSTSRTLLRSVDM